MGVGVSCRKRKTAPSLCIEKTLQSWKDQDRRNTLVDGILTSAKSHRKNANSRNDNDDVSKPPSSSPERLRVKFNLPPSDDKMHLKWNNQQVIERHTADVTACDFGGGSGGALLLATCSSDKTVRLFEVGLPGEEVNERDFSPLKGHTYAITAVRFAPNSNLLCSASVDGTCILWNAEDGSELAKLRHGSSSSLRTCAFSPSGSLLATGGDDETLVLWDVAVRTPVKTIEGHEATVTCCAFSPDSSYIVSGTSEGLLRLFDVRNPGGKCLFTKLDAHDLGVLACDFSPQFEANSSSGGLFSVFVLASGGNDDHLRVWRVEAGLHCQISLIYDLQGHSGNVMCVRFSNDGAFLASSAGDKVAIVWDAMRMYRTAVARCRVPGYTEYYGRGNSLMMRLRKTLESQYEPVKLNQCSGELRQRLEGHQRYVPCCAFAPNGRLLATGSNDCKAMLWALEEDGGSTFTRRNSNASHKSANSLDSAPRAHRLAIVAAMSTEEVGDWLENLGLPELKAVFKAHAIDGQELVHLTHDSLANVLGVETLGHRQKILREVARLKNPLWRSFTAAVDEEDNALLKECTCPITHELMRDPVVAADGYSYERGAIAEWLESGKDTSPMTNEQLEHSMLIPNKTLYLLLKKLTHSAQR